MPTSSSKGTLVVFAQQENRKQPLRHAFNQFSYYLASTTIYHRQFKFEVQQLKLQRETKNDL